MKETIVRYKNRKFYNRNLSSYVNLLEIDFDKQTVVDHVTNDDITAVYKQKALFYREVIKLGYDPRKV
jgi:polyhydroxyalkanoate synthesis regulator protein